MVQMSRRPELILAFLLALLIPAIAFADSPAFDLAGPKVDVHVQRGAGFTRTCPKASPHTTSL